MSARAAAVVLGALAALLVAPPASAAQPQRVVEPVGPGLEQELAELFEDACDVPVTVDGVGRVTYKLFTDRDGQVVRAQDTYAQRFVITNTLTGASFTIRDVGPDRVLFEDGVPVVLQQIGRSTTGSGTIGRTVFTITSRGQLVERSRSGRQFGDFVERTCDAIT